MKRLRISLLALLVTLPVPVTAREVHMCTVEWAPYYGAELPRNGMFTALTDAAFRAGGHTTTLEFMPWARAMLEVKQGDRDLVLGAYYSDERAKEYIFSDAIYPVDIGLVALKDLGVREFDSLRDLTDYAIGYGRGWATTDEFDNADYLDKVPANSNVLNVRKLYNGRIDMIAMAFDRFRSIANDEGFDIDRAVFLEPVLSRSQMHLMGSRAVDDMPQVIEDFDRGLAQIKSDGTYQTILEEMGYR